MRTCNLLDINGPCNVLLLNRQCCCLAPLCSMLYSSSLSSTANAQAQTSTVSPKLERLHTPPCPLLLKIAVWCATAHKPPKGPPTSSSGLAPDVVEAGCAVVLLLLADLCCACCCCSCWCCCWGTLGGVALWWVPVTIIWVSSQRTAAFLNSPRRLLAQQSGSAARTAWSGRATWLLTCMVSEHQRVQLQQSML
jgi:hypothetical protein